MSKYDLGKADAMSATFKMKPRSDVVVKEHNESVEEYRVRMIRQYEEDCRFRSCGVFVEATKLS